MWMWAAFLNYRGYGLWLSSIPTYFRAIPDLVVDGEMGVLIEYGDVGKMSLWLFEIATDPEHYQTMS